MSFHERTKLAARGQWSGILKHFGLPEASLKNRHGPCPMCGGNDRFRWDNREGHGTYICNQCGAGDGMSLAMAFTGRDFADVASEIDRLIRNEKFEPDREAAKRTPAETKQILRDVYSKTVKLERGDLVDTYLTSRGLWGAAYPKALRFARTLSDGHGGIRPAMVATVVDAEGKGCGLHRTFLRRDGKAKAEMEQPRLSLGDMPDGCCVRLTDDWHGGPLGIAEGIETAMAASIRFEMPVWAALNAGRLASWTPPDGCEEVAIFADCDRNFAGQAAAYRLANRLTTGKAPVPVTVHVPPEFGMDWNDVLLMERRT